MENARQNRAGLVYGISAYVCWGVLPLYLHLLKEVPPAQVLSHRIIWSLLLLGAILLVSRRLGSLFTQARGRTLLFLCASAVLIGINWFTYIWAVSNDHIVAASLGYFINPLLNVALGLIVLGERLDRLQTAAITLAGIGVLILALHGGDALWISLTLALSFGFYGLIRKIAAIDALGGLSIETAVLAPFALGFLLFAGQEGNAAFGHDRTLDVLLVLAGPITAIPLLLFAAGAKRLRFATVGLLQFIAPTLQFGEAVLVYHEPVHPAQLATFALIWAGCGLYAWSSIGAAGRAERTAAPRDA